MNMIYVVEILCMALVVFVIRIHMSQNPVAAALYLVGAFFLSALLVLILEADFIASLFVIVYVGAIAVLFLFVIMMLRTKEEFFVKDIDIKRQLNAHILAVALPILLMVYVNISDGVSEHLLLYRFFKNPSANPEELIEYCTMAYANKGNFVKHVYANVEVIASFFGEKDFFSIYDQIDFISNFGQFLFNYYVEVVLLAGILLLVALMGAVMITHNYDRSEIRESEHLLSRTDKFISFIGAIK